MDAAELFKRTLNFELPPFLDAYLWQDGFAGREKDRENLLRILADRVLARFLEDGEFAARLARATDSRSELAIVVRDIRRALPAETACWRRKAVLNGTNARETSL